MGFMWFLTCLLSMLKQVRDIPAGSSTARVYCGVATATGAIRIILTQSARGALAVMAAVVMLATAAVVARSFKLFFSVRSLGKFESS